MNKKHKKGQAAIEYLTTYGWALLILVIVIAAIVTLVPSTAFVAEECNLGPGFPCNAQMYTSEDKVHTSMRIINGYGYKVKVDEIKFYKGDQLLATKPVKEDIGAGEELLLEDVLLEGMESSNNRVESIKAELGYINCAHEVNPSCDEVEELKHTVSGRIIARVTAQ
ncbi:hypothetical protein JXB01_00435 [Candidatus Micrarchaeota archaeon]|nr:hypothetical protein [Candidatus Micrarchaeota archaeon]